ncbi:MAG: hypothetical protein ACK46C_02710 [Flavobacteriales bacterium]
MEKDYVIRLNAFDLGQLLDGLEVRANAWRHTAEYLETGQFPVPDFVMEECSEAFEARKLADHYERIIALVLEQKVMQDQL